MPSKAVFRSAADKAEAALMPVLDYLWPLDLLTAALCVAVPVLCLLQGWCRIPLRATAALLVVVVLFLGLPTAFKGTFDLDTRFIVMAAFLLAASAGAPRGAAGSIRAIGIGFLAVFLVRMAIVGAVWHSHAATLAAFRSTIASVRPGDVVMTVRRPRETTPIVSAGRLSDGTVIDAHIPALLLIEHRAWWPFLFDNRHSSRSRRASLTGHWRHGSIPLGSDRPADGESGRPRSSRTCWWLGRRRAAGRSRGPAYGWWRGMKKRRCSRSVDHRLPSRRLAADPGTRQGPGIGRVAGLTGEQKMSIRQRFRQFVSRVCLSHDGIAIGATHVGVGVPMRHQRAAPGEQPVHAATERARNWPRA